MQIEKYVDFRNVLDDFNIFISNHGGLDDGNIDALISFLTPDHDNILLADITQLVIELAGDFEESGPITEDNDDDITEIVEVFCKNVSHRVQDFLDRPQGIEPPKCVSPEEVSDRILQIAEDYGSFPMHAINSFVASLINETDFPSTADEIKSSLGTLIDSFGNEGDITEDNDEEITDLIYDVSQTISGIFDDLCNTLD